MSYRTRSQTRPTEAERPTEAADELAIEPWVVDGESYEIIMGCCGDYYATSMEWSDSRMVTNMLCDSCKRTWHDMCLLRTGHHSIESIYKLIKDEQSKFKCPTCVEDDDKKAEDDEEADEYRPTEYDDAADDDEDDDILMYESESDKDIVILPKNNLNKNKSKKKQRKKKRKKNRKHKKRKRSKSPRSVTAVIPLKKRKIPSQMAKEIKKLEHAQDEIEKRFNATDPKHGFVYHPKMIPMIDSDDNFIPSEHYPEKRPKSNAALIKLRTQMAKSRGQSYCYSQSSQDYTQREKDKLIAFMNELASNPTKYKYDIDRYGWTSQINDFAADYLYADRMANPALYATIPFRNATSIKAIFKRWTNSDGKAGHDSGYCSKFVMLKHKVMKKYKSAASSAKDSLEQLNTDLLQAKVKKQKKELEILNDQHQNGFQNQVESTLNKCNALMDKWSTDSKQDKGDHVHHIDHNDMDLDQEYGFDFVNKYNGYSEDYSNTTNSNSKAVDSRSNSKDSFGALVDFLTKIRHTPTVFDEDNVKKHKAINKCETILYGEYHLSERLVQRFASNNKLKSTISDDEKLKDLARVASILLKK
eukprot:50111_1